MKRIIFLVVLCSVTIWAYDIRAVHLNFMEIECIGGKLLKDFTDEEYAKYYRKVEGRVFAGWKTYRVNSFEIKYTKEILLSYYNDSPTPIKYDYNYERAISKKTSITSSGSIKLTASGDIKKFKSGLNTELKIDTSETSSSEEKEKINIKFDIDPGYMLNYYVLGHGYVENGVAAKYVFWIRTIKGGYEIFNMSTEYTRLEKIPV